MAKTDYTKKCVISKTKGSFHGQSQCQTHPNSPLYGTSGCMKFWRKVVASLLTLKANCRGFDTLTGKQLGIMINNDVFLFSATNEETAFEQLLLIFFTEQTLYFIVRQTYLNKTASYKLLQGAYLLKLFINFPLLHYVVDKIHVVITPSHF